MSVPKAKRAQVEQVGRTVHIEQGQTLLQAALDAGIAYPHGCRSGRCGSCKSRLLQGDVTLLPHTPFALTEDEKQRGLILACRAQPQTDINVRWLAQEAVSHPVVVTDAEVVGLVHLTHDIVELRLRTNRAITYAPGQYAHLQLCDAPGRDYSMAPSEHRDVLVFNIRVVPGGRVSTRLAAGCVRGQKVRVTGPFGEAYLREDHTNPILAVAGGSGYAPIAAILERAVALEMNQPIHFYHGVRDTHDVYGADWIRSLAERHRNLTCHTILSAPTSAAHNRSGLVHEAIAADIGDMAGWKVYMAGPPVMVDAVVGLCVGRRLRRQDVHADVFFTPEGEAVQQAVRG